MILLRPSLTQWIMLLIPFYIWKIFLQPKSQGSRQSYLIFKTLTQIVLDLLRMKMICLALIIYQTKLSNSLRVIKESDLPMRERESPQKKILLYLKMKLANLLVVQQLTVEWRGIEFRIKLIKVTFLTWSH